MQLEVKSYPAGKIVSDLARQTGSDLTQVDEVYISVLSSKIGKGLIRGINFPSGMSILVFNCQFNDSTSFNFTNLEDQQALIVYVNKGRLKLNLNSGNGPFKIHRFQTSKVDLNEDSIHLTDRENHEFFILHIDKGINLSNKIAGANTLHAEILQMLAGIQSTANFGQRVPYNIDLEDIFEEAMHIDPQADPTKILSLESKTFQALHHQLKKQIKETEQDQPIRTLPEWEVEAIHQAVLFIKNNLEKEITIKQLSHLTGLNPNKLQFGFKVLCGFTVHNYLKYTRLRVAEEMILNSDLTISEIVYKIGLINRGYFSKLFKNKNGVTPTEYRKRQRLVPNHPKSAAS